MSEVKTDLDGVFIRSTYDYDQFMVIQGSKIAQPWIVDRLVDSMQLSKVTSVMIVNEKNEIIDGAHSLEACKRLKYPVLYVTV